MNPGRLDPAEIRVLIMLAAGRSVESIAEQLGVKRSTVSTHRSRILRKTGTVTIASAFVEAERQGAVMRADMIGETPDILARQRDDAEQRIARALAALDRGDARAARIALLRQNPDACLHPPSRSSVAPAGFVRCEMCYALTVHPHGATPALVEWTVPCRACRAEYGKPCRTLHPDGGRVLAGVHATRRRMFEDAR